MDPITSFAIAAVLWGISATGLLRPAWAQAVVAHLVFVNIAVGIFNLVPGFPLDGGRLLRAALWKWKGTLDRATYTASRIGVLFAFALMGLGLLQIFAGAILGGFWMIVIGVFLRGAADASYSQMALREALVRIPVRNINEVGRLAVLEGSRLVGYLSLKDITHILALRGRPDGVRGAHRAPAGKPGPARRAA